MERVFKLAGKTHYSNVSFQVGSIISTGLSALVFTGTGFYGKLPYSGAYLSFFLSFLDVYSACAGAPPFSVVLVLIKESKLL